MNGEENTTYSYEPVFKSENNFSLSIIAVKATSDTTWEYTIVDDKNLDKNLVLTDEIIEGYREIKTIYRSSAIFVNMDDFDRIEKNLMNNMQNEGYFLHTTSTSHIKIKCNNIIQFSKYMENISDISYYTLQGREKIIYINIIQLMLRVIILAIVIVGIVSTVNIINASLCEREQEFKMLNSLGATRKNINKILIYESIYMFIKAAIISVILSIPIIIGIIKYMQNIITLNKLLIPFGEIAIFFVIILLISIIITLCSGKKVKQ